MQTSTLLLPETQPKCVLMNDKGTLIFLDKFPKKASENSLGNKAHIKARLQGRHHGGITTTSIFRSCFFWISLYFIYSELFLLI